MYTLRFPFRLPPGQAIAVTDQSTQLGDLTLSLKREDRYYVLTIDGFSSGEAARQYVNNIWSGLMWVLLNLKLSPDVVLELQKVAYADDPYEAAKNLSKSFGLRIKGKVNGLIDGSRPAVYPTEKQLRVATLGEPTVLISTPAEDALKFLIEGASFPKSKRIIEDHKLRVALELYGAYFTEFSANAKFLTLVMALEALAIGKPRTQLVLELLDKWHKEIKEIEKRIKPETEDSASIEALKRELLFRKEDSIRRQIRMLVYNTLTAVGDEDADETANLAVKVYDLRSTLVHEGRLRAIELSSATSDAKRIVERVLRAGFRQDAGDEGKINV